MELAHPKNVSFPMTVDRSTVPHAGNDVVYLNIHENMEDGKMQTCWFNNTARALKYYTYWPERVVESKLYMYDFENPVLKLMRKKIYSDPRVLKQAGKRRTKKKLHKKKII
jgi:hypothetical protein